MCAADDVWLHGLQLRRLWWLLRLLRDVGGDADLWLRCSGLRQRCSRGTPKKEEKKEEKKEKKMPEEETLQKEPGFAPARIVVTLPADAKLYFNNKVTAKGSDRREFESPPLDPGMIYEYTLKAETVVNGKSQVESRTVEVRAGQKSTVIFVFPTTVVGK